MELMGLALVAGSVWMLFAARPGLKKGAGLATRLRIASLLGVGVVIVAMAAEVDLTARSTVISERGLLAAYGYVLTRTNFSHLILLRWLTALSLGGIWYRLGCQQRSESIQFVVVVVVVALAVVLTFGRNLVGYVAVNDAGSYFVNVMLDLLHLLAANGWIGGIALLLVVLPTVRKEVARLLVRSSNIAILAVAAIAITGVNNAWLEVSSFRAFAETKTGVLSNHRFQFGNTHRDTSATVHLLVMHHLSAPGSVIPPR